LLDPDEINPCNGLIAIVPDDSLPTAKDLTDILDDILSRRSFAKSAAFISIDWSRQVVVLSTPSVTTKLRASLQRSYGHRVVLEGVCCTDR